MSMLSVKKIMVESSGRTIPGVDDLSTVELKDLPVEMQNQIKELAATIKADGLLQPIVVKGMKGDKYRLIAGFRRLMAHKHLEKVMIDAKVLKGKKEDEVVLRLKENIHREDMNPMEIALCLDEIKRVKHITSQGELSREVKKSESWVSNYLRLLKVDETVQVAVKEKRIPVAGARAISGLSKEEQKKALSDMEKEAKESGSVDKNTGKPRIKAKGARRHVRKAKKEKSSKQVSMRPVKERENEQKIDFVASFFDDEYGQKNVTNDQKEAVEKFWDYLFEKNRLIIK